MFSGTPDDPFKPGLNEWSLSDGIAALLGLSQVQPSVDPVNFTANIPLSIALTGTQRLVGPLQAYQDYKPEVAKEPMTAFYDATTLTIRLEAATLKIRLRDLMEKTKARLSKDAGKQAAVSFEIARDTTIIIDSVYGDLNATPPLGSVRFWLILPQ